MRAEKHLPGVPSAREVAANGVSVAEIQAKMLATVEELILRMIDMDKPNARLRDRVAQLEAQLGQPAEQ